MNKKCANNNRSKMKHKLKGQNAFLSLFFLYICSFFCLTACYENQEGCLDVAAQNFDLDADRDCGEDCCVYPTFEVSFLHRFKDAIRDTFYTFSLNTPYAFTTDDTFQVSNIQFYLSDFKLLLEDGRSMVVEDEDKLEVFAASIDTIPFYVEDNFVLVDRSRPATNEVGTIRGVLDCTGIEFKLGIKDSVNVADPTYFETTHPLYSELDGEMYFSQDSGYVFNRVDIAAPDSTVVLMGTSDFLQTIVVDFPFSTKLGFNTTAVLRVDYREWFQEIDFQNDSAETMAAKIQQGVQNSFTLLEIQN